MIDIIINIQDLIYRVNNKDAEFSRKPELVAKLNSSISKLIGDSDIYLSEFVIAKVKGKIAKLNSHSEITDKIISSIPFLLQFPQKILRDTRSDNKYLFIISNPFIEIVIEVNRAESGKTEIYTFHKINIDELKRLERKFPVVL